MSDFTIGEPTNVVGGERLRGKYEAIYTAAQKAAPNYVPVEFPDRGMAQSFRNAAYMRRIYDTRVRQCTVYIRVRQSEEESR